MGLGDDVEEERELQESSDAVGFKRDPEPSAKDIKDHELSQHIPFRSWCKHCVMGKAKSDYHRKGITFEGEKPIISMDYMYMNEKKPDGRRTAVVEGSGLS